MQKTVNGVVTDYTLHGKNVVHMKQGSDELHFFYDAQNKPAVVVYNGTPYSYVKNLQGDIVAILDSTGTVVVSYVYDAWGRPISCSGTMANTLGTVQPFRYRSYVFDEETELYYLMSRCYNAIACRFASADIFFNENIYAYCCNSPTMCHDENGYSTSPFKTAVAIDSYVDTRTAAKERAAQLGNAIVLSKGAMQFDISAYREDIASLEEYFSLRHICDVMSFTACAQYEKAFGEPFLLDELCVSGEIEAHIVGYDYATGDRFLPNSMVLGYKISSILFEQQYPSRADTWIHVWRAEIYEADAKIDETWLKNLASQATAFGYKEGIRDIYLGTDRDPWRNER